MKQKCLLTPGCHRAGCFPFLASGVRKHPDPATVICDEN